MRSSSSLLRCLARSSAPRAARASPPANIPAPKRRFHMPRTATPTLLRPSPVLTSLRSLPSALRHESSSSDSTPHTAASTTTAPDSRLERDQVPAYEMTFTCNKCTTRSSHRVSKQGYHHGTVLITCPGCKNRHLMSDHLKIFSDKSVTIEDLIREKGQFVKKGSLSAEGDVEFWDDGTTTPRSAKFIPNTTTKSDPDAEEGRLTESPSRSAAASPETMQSSHKL
ncbi:zf-DNL-domain-containing protein [Melanomma pulvis-pyrius CBS 109.77]|uniref:Zf-DNL-domain-containing protein n=1 Tax=Melanomma pulvis-pyrius CBS 109.77 TaxID=1314802 RepID=A0A6A6XJG0_9PLEO|nr:zf-DNL-domain-containing protein [Melanomma pulvis-pyrius CBS 109.77]